MKKGKKLVTQLIVIVIAFIIWKSISYTTQENEYTVVKQFGEILRINQDAGLSFKVPIIQNISSIPKSLQFYDLPKSEVITSDKKTMIVNAYITWRIVDPKVFIASLNASTSSAEGRINIITYNAIKTTISNMTQEELLISRDDPIDLTSVDAVMEDLEIQDIVSEEDNKDVEVIAMSTELLKAIEGKCDQYGIKIEDIKIKILDLPNENKDAVYERMITERENIAAAYIAQGQSEAQMIQNITDKEVSVMLSDANASAEKTIAEGEAEYMRILSDAYNDESKADFYLFKRSLDAIEKSLSSGETTIFLDSNSPIAEVLQGVH